MIALVCFLICVLTFSLSGVQALGGGIMLISLLAFLVEPEMIIPIHALSVVAANVVRTTRLWPSVDFRILTMFLLGSALGATIAHLFLVVEFNETSRLLIAVMIFLSIFFPKVRIPDFKGRWILVGCIVTITALYSGAAGPLVAIFFFGSGLTPVQNVATRSAIGVYQLIKLVPIFLGPYSVPFDAGMYSACIGGAMLGSFLSTRWLRLISEDVFDKLLKATLLAIAIFFTYSFIASY